MKKPHFFKAYSRIGLMHKPIHQETYNIGVEDGPDAILDDEFLSHILDYALSSYTFPLPEEMTAEIYHKTLGESLSDFATLISNKLQPNEQQIVIGGDHSITLPSVIAVLQQISSTDEIGYIHFDSHGDSNQRADSPTGNFHGMYLRPLFDTFDIPEIDALVPKKLSPHQALFIGNLDLDTDEKAFFTQYDIKNIARHDIVDNKVKVIEDFSMFVHMYRYIHISFDIDIFDHTEVMATGIPAANGFFLKDILPFLDILAAHNHVSFDLAEVNPRKDGAKETIQIAQTVLHSILKV